MPGPSLQVNLGTQANGTGSVTPAYPVNTQRGSLCFLMCNSAYNETVTLSDPQGFTLLGAVNSLDTTSTGCRATVFYKIAEGTEPGRALGDAMTAPTIADPGDHIVAKIVNYTNYWPGYVIESVSTEGFASTAFNTNINLTGVTVSQLASELIYFVADGLDSAAARTVVFANGTGSSATEGSDFTTATTDGTGGGICFVGVNVNPQATVGTATWKMGSGTCGYAAVKVVVRCPIIRYVATSTTSGTGDVAAAIPAHGATDLLVLVVETANEAVATPSGWTLIGSVTNGSAGTGTAQYVYWLRDATAALTTVTVTDPGDHAFCKVHRFPGARQTGNPINGFATGTGSGNSVTFPDLTTTVDQCQILYGISNIDASAGGPTISSTPATPYVNTNNTTTGPTAIHMRNSSGGTTGTIPGGLSLAVANQEKAGALGTTTVPVDATGTSNTFFTLAIEPDGARVAFTQVGDTVAATVTQADNAAVAFTQAANTVAATAAQLNHVVVNFTQAGDTIAGTITHPTLATVVVTQAGDSIVASAIQVDPAQVTITQAPNTVAAAATQTDKAVVAFTQAGDTIAGTITHPTVAVVAFTQAGDSVVAAGAQLNHAAVAITQAANTVAASAIQVNPAQIAFTQAPNTVAAEVQLPSISTNSPAYGIQPITVTWTRLGDKGADTIIAIARQGAAEADMFAWVYTNGTQVAPVSVVANGSYTFPAVTSPGTYVARVITSGAGPAWTVDATSGKAVPANSTEWTALLAAAGIASGGPANIWNCQDASGVLVDANGALNLGVSGDGTQLYFQTVTGWTRKGVQLTDGASARFEATIPGSGTSFIALFYVRLTGVPGATRTVLEHPNIFAEVSGTPRYQADGNSLVVGTVNPGTATHPVLLKSNASNTTEGVYTDDEKLNPTYNSFAGTAMRLGTVGGNGSPGMQAVYGVRFTGAAAELSDAQIKTLLQTLGWTIPWS